MKVYISGPISGLSVKEFTENFAEAAELLRDNGYEPVNPVEVQPDCGDTCNPHDPSYPAPGQAAHSWVCYMKEDIKLLMDCEGILMLENWGGSRGAMLEFSIADQLGYKKFAIDQYGELWEIT